MLSAVMSSQNELITPKDGSHTVQEGRGSVMMSDGLTWLFTLDLIRLFIVCCCVLCIFDVSRSKAAAAAATKRVLFFFNLRGSAS